MGFQDITKDEEPGISSVSETPGELHLSRWWLDGFWVHDGGGHVCWVVVGAARSKKKGDRSGGWEAVMVRADDKLNEARSGPGSDPDEAFELFADVDAFVLDELLNTLKR
uniref:Uncharacterized protein n=1 Tax=Cannabis sativa TaxID=3483 RepID=A0A803QFK6_CANSA